MAEQQYEIRNKRMLVVAGILGLVCVLVVNLHIGQIRRENELERVDVLKTKRDLRANDRLGERDVDVVKFPRSMVPTSDFQLIATAADKDALMNMTVTQDVEEGKIMLWSYVTGGVAQFGDRITPRIGWLLVPIKVDLDRCPVAVASGSLVDLCTTLTDDKGLIRTVKVMEKVLVKSVTSQGGRMDSVIVEVKEDDAFKLISFKATGRALTVLIRHPGDTTTTIKDACFNPDLESLLRYDVPGPGRGLMP